MIIVVGGSAVDSDCSDNSVRCGCGGWMVVGGSAVDSDCGDNNKRCSGSGEMVVGCH